MEFSSSTIVFAPLLAEFPLILIFLIFLSALLFAFYAFRKSIPLRIIAFAVIFIAVLNPSIKTEERESVKDKAIILVDNTASQNIAQRKSSTQKALEHYKEEFSKIDNLDTEIIELTGQENEGVGGTMLFSALEKGFADIPKSRRAGALIITDGVIHDTPNEREINYPVNALITGEKGEKDRRVQVNYAPAYGIVGQEITIKFKIEDFGTDLGKNVEIELRSAGNIVGKLNVQEGIEQEVTFEIENAGDNYFEITAQNIPNEITTVNNTAHIMIKGIKDRMRVLLVSGLPYIGERTWRNILTSDPGIDLIHFTILRTPDKINDAPSHEMALIAFPVDELFDKKLDSFDLVIFDRYKVNWILPPVYFDNIREYTEKGGGLLITSGPSFAGENSLYNTALGDIIPAKPAGVLMEEKFTPQLTEIGEIHPVTSFLEKDGQKYGNWFRQVPVIADNSSDILMNGIDNHPLLILKRTQKGRIAQIASDQIWLWARGYNGGGPYSELLRRIIHWLLKEPELDENLLDIKLSENDVITVTKRNIGNLSDNTENNEIELVMHKPDGSSEKINLKPLQSERENHKGLFSADIKAEQQGVYSFEAINDNIITNNTKSSGKFILVGEMNGKEMNNIVSTEDILAPIVTDSGGYIGKINNKFPDISYDNNLPDFIKYNKIRLIKNNDFVVTGVSLKPLMPAWLYAILALILIVLAWWREGKNTVAKY